MYTDPSRILSALCLLLVALLPCSWAENVEVTFPDVNLEARIRVLMNQPTGPIMSDNLVNVGGPNAVVDLSHAKISSLTGLEYLTRTRTLSLEGNKISDLAPVASLKRLAKLDVSDNRITDIRPLASNWEMDNLDLSDNRVQDLSALKGLGWLTSLDISENQVEDLSPLSELEYLESIHLTDNLVSDLLPLTNSRFLNYIYADRNLIKRLPVFPPHRSDSNPTDIIREASFAENEIMDLQPILDSPRFVVGSEVAVSGNPLSAEVCAFQIPILEDRDVVVYFDPCGPPADTTVVDIPDPVLEAEVRRLTGNIDQPLTRFDLRHIKSLTIHGELADLTGLESCTYLTSIDTNDCNVTSLAPLVNLQYLTEIMAANNELTELPYLKGLSSLNVLRIPGNHVQDISPLTTLERLYILDLSRNPVRDLKPLTGQKLPLFYLWLDEVNIQDLSPLSSFFLFELHLEGNALTDISILASVQSQALFLSRNAISDLSPLANSLYIQTLHLRENDITDLSPISNLLPSELRLDGNEIQDLTPLANMLQLERLSLNQNKVQDVTPLAALSKLRELGLSGNQIEDVSPLAGPGDFTRRLVLSDNQIDSLAPFVEGDSWDYLDVRKNPLADEVCVTAIPELIERGYEVELDGCGARPIAVCVAPLTVQLSKGTIFPADLDNGSSDPRGRPLAFSLLAQANGQLAAADAIYSAAYMLSCADVLYDSLTLTVRVDNGLNWSSCEVDVTVVDDVPPLMATRNTTVQLAGDGSASIQPSDVDNGSADNCGLTLTISQSVFSCADLGANEVVLTGTDDAGNVSEATAIVTVLDGIPPVASARGLTFPLGPDGTALLDPTLFGAGSRDNCLPQLHLSKTLFTCDDLGDNVVTLTVSDASGNTSQANAVVTVTDPDERCDVAKEGQSEGIQEGNPEGALEGQAEGFIEGATEGDVEGEGEGGPDGIFDCQGCTGGNKSLLGMGDLLTLFFSMAALLAMQRPLRK